MNLLIIERKTGNAARKHHKVKSVDDLNIEISANSSANALQSAGVQEYMRKLGVGIRKIKLKDGLC